jgi:hypothetical protein
LHFIHRFHPSWCGALGGGGDGGVADNVVADGGEADGGSGDVGAARLEDAAAVGGSDGVDRGMAAQAGDDTTWTGDDGCFRDAGMMGRGEDAPSQGDVGVEGGGVDVSAIGGEASGSLTDGGVAGALTHSPPPDLEVVLPRFVVIWIFCQWRLDLRRGNGRWCRR